MTNAVMIQVVVLLTMLLEVSIIVMVMGRQVYKELKREIFPTRNIKRRKI